jgi:hypothetical protein
MSARNIITSEVQCACDRDRDSDSDHDSDSDSDSDLDRDRDRDSDSDCDLDRDRDRDSDSDSDDSDRSNPARISAAFMVTSKGNRVHGLGPDARLASVAPFQGCSPSRPCH